MRERLSCHATGLIRPACRERQIMQYHEDERSYLRAAPGEHHHCDLVAWIKRAGRLIQTEQRRIPRGRLGKAHQLLLPAGELTQPAHRQTGDAACLHNGCRADQRAAG